MAEKLPAKTSKFGKYVIKPEEWIMDLILSNCDILPKKCRPVLLDVAYKGYIEDEEKFSEMFDILQMIVTGDMIGETITPEVYWTVKEGRNLKLKRDEADFELQEFEEHMRQWNLEAFEKLKKRGATPSKIIYKIPEGEEPQH